MKIDPPALSDIMLEVAVRLFDHGIFRRRELMNATETEVRRRGFWTSEDDVLSGSAGIKSRGLATIDFRFSDLARTGRLVAERRDSWRVSPQELVRIRNTSQISASAAPRDDVVIAHDSGALSVLRPQAKEFVYDLVKQTGIDTSDWANYARPVPASNPKYCYNWSFEGPGHVAMCLWFQEMERDAEEIF